MPNEKPDVMKSLTYGLILIILGALIPGCVGTKSRQAVVVTDAAAPLEFGVFPFLEAGNLLKALSPLTVYLSRNLNRRIEICLVSDYADLEKLVAQRRVDIGWFSPRSRANPGGVRMIPLCRPRPTGRDHYFGVIVAKTGSGIASLSDLRGKTFAFVDRNSKSGFIYPNRLFREQGIDPLTFFRDIAFAGSYDRCMAGVMNGSYDAAAVSELVFKGKGVSDPIFSQIEVIATTAAILADPLLVSENLDPELRAKIRDLLLTPEKFPQGKEAMEALRSITGISAFVSEP